MTKDYRVTVNDIDLPYNWSLGATWTRFFDGLKDGKIFGTKCKKCGKVFVPARSFCPDCLEDMEEWIEIAQEGIVESWTLVNNKYPVQVKEPPYAVASIHLDGADCNFIHFINGFDLSDISKVGEKVKIGTRVKAVWSEKRSADIYDIAYFEPITSA